MFSHISIIAALGLETRVIGRNGKDIWHIPKDRKRFRELTTGHSVIMGRKTVAAIDPKYFPLPNRTNIVLTRDDSFEIPPEDTITAPSIEIAVAIATLLPGKEEVFIAGGGQIYAQALTIANKLHLTLVDSAEEGDTLFPRYQQEFTKVLFEENHEYEGLKYTFLTLEREYPIEYQDYALDEDIIHSAQFQKLRMH